MSDEHLEDGALHQEHEVPERREQVGAPEAKAEDQSLQPEPPKAIPVPEAEKPERPVEAAFPFAPPPPPPAPKPGVVLDDAEVIGGILDDDIPHEEMPKPLEPEKEVEPPKAEKPLKRKNGSHKKVSKPRAKRTRKPIKAKKSKKTKKTKKA